MGEGTELASGSRERGRRYRTLLGVLGHPADVHLARRLLLALLLRGLVEHEVLGVLDHGAD
jgi:hypothetical protein